MKAADTTMPTLRWGILGTAAIADSVIPGIRASGCGRVVAVASRDAGKARSWADARGIPLSFRSYDAMLKSGEIDVVYNPLPNRLHAEWTIRALQAGIPVLCEKPFSTSAVEARAVADVSARTGRLAVEAFMYCHHPLYRRLQAALSAGEIGSVVSICSGFTFLLDDRTSIVASPELAGGALMDVGCYPVHFARLVTGREPLRAVAFERRTTVDDSLFGLLEFPDGVVASIECSIESHERQHASITGTAGTIVIDKPWFPGNESSRFVIHREGLPDQPETVTCPGDDPYRCEVIDFTRAVTKGEPPRWGIEDAVANMAAIDALYAAAALGRSIDVSVP